jgi:ArsR family transcriptional regulator
MFRAFSDRTRLRILVLLQKRELCVCDLVEALSVSQPKISRHLAYLRRSGLVITRRQGVWMYYSLATPRSTFHRQMLVCLESCLADVPELMRDAKRLDKKMDEPC